MSRSRTATRPSPVALEDVSVPALLCSLVHMTGDPAWVRGDIQPNVAHVVRHPGRDVGRGHGRGAPPRPAGHRRLSRRRLRAGRAVPGPAARDDGASSVGARVEGPLAGLFFDDLQFEGGDSGADLLGRRDLGGADELRRRSSSSAAAWAGSWPASASSRPGCPSPSSTRTRVRVAPGGRTATRAPASTSGATSTASPSSRPSTGASTTASSRNSAPTSARSSTSSDSGRTADSRHRVTELVWHEDRAVWRVTVRDASGAEVVLEARFVDQRRWLAEPPPAARHPGHGRPSPVRRSTRPAGPRTSTSRGPGSRSSAPAPADSRSVPPSPTRSSS